MAQIIAVARGSALQKLHYGSPLIKIMGSYCGSQSGHYRRAFGKVKVPAVAQASESVWFLFGFSCQAALKFKSRQAEESVWQPRFPQVVFFVEALNLSCFNKSGNRKGMWKSIFATSHTDSSACLGLTFCF